MLAECNNNSLARIKLQDGPIPPPLNSFLGVGRRWQESIFRFTFLFHFPVLTTRNAKHFLTRPNKNILRFLILIYHLPHLSPSVPIFLLPLAPLQPSGLLAISLVTSSPATHPRPAIPPFLNPNSTVCRWCLTPPSTLPNRMSLAICSVALRRLAR